MTTYTIADLPSVFSEWTKSPWTLISESWTKTIADDEELIINLKPGDKFYWGDNAGELTFIGYAKSYVDKKNNWLHNPQTFPSYEESRNAPVEIDGKTVRQTSIMVTLPSGLSGGYNVGSEIDLLRAVKIS